MFAWLPIGLLAIGCGGGGAKSDARTETGTETAADHPRETASETIVEAGLETTPVDTTAESTPEVPGPEVALAEGGIDLPTEGSSETGTDAAAEGPPNTIDASDSFVTVDAPDETSTVTDAGVEAGADAQAEAAPDVAPPADAADSAAEVAPETGVGDTGTSAPWSQIHPCTAIGWDSRPLAVAFAPGGAVVAMGGSVIKEFSVATGAVVATYAGLTGTTRSLAYSPDGSMLVGTTGGASIRTAGEYTVVAWRTTDRSVVWRRPLGTVIRAQAFSPDGTLLALAANDKSVILVKAATGETVRAFTGHQGYVDAVAFAPDGTQVASGEALAAIGQPSVIHIWRVGDLGVVRTLTGPSSGVLGLAYSPDGSQLLAGNGVRWQVSTGTALQTNLATGPVAFAPNGQSFFAGSLRRASDGVAIRAPSSTNFRAVAYAPNSETLFLVPNPDTSQPIPEPYFWAVADGAVGIRIDNRFIGGQFGLSPDGTRVVVSGSRMFYIASGLEVASYRPALNDYVRGVFSPDGSLVAVADDPNLGPYSISLLDATTGVLRRRWTAHTAKISSLRFSPTGDMLASGSGDQTVKLWRVSDGTLVRTLGGINGHTSAVHDVTFAPDGQTLASSGFESAVLVWRVSDGMVLRTLPNPGNATRPAFSPDGSWLITSGSSGATIWSTSLWQVVRTFGVRYPGGGSFTGAQAIDSSGSVIASVEYYGTAVWSASDASLLAWLPYPDTGVDTWTATVGDGVIVSTGGAAIYWCRH